MPLGAFAAPGLTLLALAAIPVKRVHDLLELFMADGLAVFCALALAVALLLAVLLPLTLVLTLPVPLALAVMGVGPGRTGGFRGARGA